MTVATWIRTSAVGVSLSVSVILLATWLHPRLNIEQAMTAISLGLVVFVCAVLEEQAKTAWYLEHRDITPWRDPGPGPWRRCSSNVTEFAARSLLHAMPADSRLQYRVKNTITRRTIRL